MRINTNILIFTALFGIVSTASASPQKIISLGPRLTEQIYILGAEEKLAAVTIYCKNPAAAQKKEKVGTVLDADLEKIIYLQPDLVLTTALTNVKTKRKLKTLGIKTADFPQAKNFKGICTEFLQLGQILDRQARAEEIIQQSIAKVEAVQARAEKCDKVKVFVQVGTNPLFTMTKDSFFNDFIEFSGGENIARGAKSGFYSREKVLECNPDVIIITAMGIAGEEEKKLWERFPALNAAKYRQIYVVDAYRFCSPTPVSFVEALEQMYTLLHGKGNE